MGMGGVSTLAKSYREGRGKSEGDANAEREADKKLVMECARGRGWDGEWGVRRVEGKGGEIYRGGWKGGWLVSRRGRAGEGGGRGSRAGDEDILEKQKVRNQRRRNFGMRRP